MRYFLFLAFAFIFRGLYAQTPAISFSYDVAGNRIKRELVILPGKKDKSDTTHIPPTMQKDSLGNIAVNLYPNPTQGHLTITINAKSTGALADVYVFDLSGKMMDHKQINTTSSTDLDMTNYSPGIYQLKLIADNKTSAWKIIKE